MPEQLALQEPLGDRCAVDRDKRFFGPAGAEMNGSRQELLPGSGLSGDEHGAVGVGDLRHKGKDLPDLRALPDDVLEAVFFLQLAAERSVFLLEDRMFQRLRHEGGDILQVERLGHIVIRAGADRLDRRGDRPKTGHDDRNQVRLNLTKTADHLDPGDLRKHEIDQKEIKRPCPQELLRLSPFGE